MKKAVLFGLLLFSVLSFNLKAQKNQLFQLTSAKFNNISLDSALHILEDKIELNFTYNSVFTGSQKTINAEFNFIPLSIILDSLFVNPCINFKTIDKQIVIYNNKDSIDETSPASNITKTIRGKIIDNKSGEILAFSSIGILNGNIGTITNNDGFFILTIPSKYINDTIAITHIGYFKNVIPVMQINNDTVFRMEQQSISLPEIVIRNSAPDELIRKAIKKVKTNYISDPFILRAFYRETVKKNKKYMLYSEGILDLYKRPSRPTIYHDQIRLIKQRKFTNINPQDTVLFKLKGGLRSSLQLDITRNSLEFIETESLDLYKYKINDMLIIDGRLAYLIDFEPRSKKTIPAFKGEIYIDVSSLTFIKIVFEYTKKSIKDFKSSFVLKTSKKIKAIPNKIIYDISYRETGGKYYINHVNGNLKFRVKKRGKLLSSIYETAFEMVTTDINNSNPERFSSAETLKSNKIFSEQSSNYSTDFWQNNNFIYPEENLLKALERFNKEELEINNN